MAQIKKEFRVAQLQPAESDDMIVEGYAVVFEQPTVLYKYDGIEYKEVIDRNALVGADLSDVPFKYNHSNDFLVLARTRNKTLQLEVDNFGLKIRANLANVTAGKDLYELIKRGDIDKMSFAFTVNEEEYDSQTHTRRVLKIEKIYDVSAVDTPAYDGTTISARDYFTAQAESEKQVKEQEKRKRLYLLTF